MTPRIVYILAFALAATLTFAGCQTAPQPGPKRDVAADTTAIDALLDRNIAAWNSNDAAAVTATFADDAILMEPDLAAIEGKQAIQTWYEAFLKENAVKCAITPLETQVAGDWAYVRGNYTSIFTPKSGKSMGVSGKYLDIVKRQPDGSWKIHRGMLNSNGPPPGAEKKKP